MNVRRRGHSCGKMEKDGKTVLVVAGGFDESLSDLDSMEYLVLSDDQGWKLGKASLAGQFSIFNSKNSVKTIGANYQVQYKCKLRHHEFFKSKVSKKKFVKPLGQNFEL